jgi:hypothetical protein
MSQSQDKDPNQGEGDRVAGRRYDEKARAFVAEGKVPEAATEARAYVERDPADAAKAEARAKRGPLGGRVVATGQAVVDTVRPSAERVASRLSRAVETLRARFGRK